MQACVGKLESKVYIKVQLNCEESLLNLYNTHTWKKEKKLWRKAAVGHSSWCFCWCGRWIFHLNLQTSTDKLLVRRTNHNSGHNLHCTNILVNLKSRPATSTKCSWIVKRGWTCSLHKCEKEKSWTQQLLYFLLVLKMDSTCKITNIFDQIVD